MITEKLIKQGKAIGEIYSDFDLLEESTKICPICGAELEWNGFCSEC